MHKNKYLLGIILCILFNAHAISIFEDKNFWLEFNKYSGTDEDQILQNINLISYLLYPGEKPYHRIIRVTFILEDLYMPVSVEIGEKKTINSGTPVYDIAIKWTKGNKIKFNTSFFNASEGKVISIFENIRNGQNLLDIDSIFYGMSRMIIFSNNIPGNYFEQSVEYLSLWNPPCYFFQEIWGEAKNNEVKTALKCLKKLTIRLLKSRKIDPDFLKEWGKSGE